MPTEHVLPLTRHTLSLFLLTAIEKQHKSIPGVVVGYLEVCAVVVH